MNIQILSVGVVMGILLIYFVILTVAIVMLWNRTKLNNKLLREYKSIRRRDMHYLEQCNDNTQNKITETRRIIEGNLEHLEIATNSYTDSRIDKLDLPKIQK